MLSQRKLSLSKQQSRKDKLKSILKLKPLKKGNVGVYSEQAGKITHNQVKATLAILRRVSQRQVKFWFYIKDFRAITKKPSETRLGRGKGKIKYWASVVKPGSLIFEFKCVTDNYTLTNRVLQKFKFKVFNKNLFIWKKTRWIL